MRMHDRRGVIGLLGFVALAAVSTADTLKFKDGRTLENCYVRDEGTWIRVWESLNDVGSPPEAYRAEEVDEFKIERDDGWDRRPDLPDLTVTFIELNPKLASLHGHVHYDKYGRPKIAGAEVLDDVGERAYLHPERVVEDVKLNYRPGEPITLTAHVRNVGFKAAQPFEYVWRIDNEVVERGRYDKPLGEMDVAEFTLRWEWPKGHHHATFSIETDQEEIATINNRLRDPLWGFSFTYVVNPGRVAAWHQFRNAYGTFSWEDFYRWHIDIMNQLFEDSVYPAAPDGILARVRLDRIVYTDEPNAKADEIRRGDDGLIHDQGAWVWRDNEEELKTGQWIQTDPQWRNRTEWSLPHELGHQLGLVDWYALDYVGHDNHTWPDNGAKISHFQRHPMQMMHWHGPQPYGEVDAAYLNYTIDKPRGYFGDMYFANPRECFLRVVDINGRPLAEAPVEIFQRGVVVDADGQPGEQQGVKYYPVIEDGDFYGPPISKRPVIVGMTDADGLLRLPNRPAKEVRTLSGFHRTDNPFGNMNVVGPRNLMLAKVTRNGRESYFWLEGHDFVQAWFRGHKERFVMTLPTPYGSADSPPPPATVAVKRLDGNRVKVTWQPPAHVLPRNYLHRVIGYRVYRRTSNDGMRDRPWLAVATLGPDTREAVLDLGQRLEDIYWYKPITERFGVTAVAGNATESELVEVVLPEP